MKNKDVAAMLAKGGPVEGEDLSRVDWSDAVFDTLELKKCVLVDSQFAGASLIGARFSECKLTGARFSQADLRNAVFESCTFSDGTYFDSGQPRKPASFFISDLRGSRFIHCDLSFVVFEKSDMHDIRMERCNLRGSRFERASFSQSTGKSKAVANRAAFTDCNLELSDLADTDLHDCLLNGSSLREANLSGADLRGADMRGCDFFQAVLDSAKLDGANVRGADVSGLNLLAVASFGRIKLDQDQLHLLLAAMGADIKP